ncbi:hypothetical protein PsorP6_014410 [Peronosclerospora sorghi]|uniref:Uncharacterized protein n=1 Tax=Peronosclerospora sorghi TaxID=230839 RepID=A0ACC0VHX1_9STRA|nr:hypothetical protein PsorP6_014410 [Peronosclerospora sorghi]
MLRFLCLAVSLLPVALASRFQFTLSSRLEECFMEEVNARAANNKMLFRFGILEPMNYDLVDVAVKTPSQREVLSWKAEQNNFASAKVRESGLYHLCFRKLKGSSSTLRMFYSFDFISAGVRSLTLVPNVAATAMKDAPTELKYTEMALTTVEGQATKLGVMEFSLVGVSRNVLRGNTRVKLLLMVDSITNAEVVDIALALLPKPVTYPVLWETLGSYASGGYLDHVIDNAVTELGSHVAFDITEIFQDKLDRKDEFIGFSIHSDKDNDAIVSGIDHVSRDFYPQIVVEDPGLELMHEVAYFKESVFTLRGDISFIKHRERLSRDGNPTTAQALTFIVMQCCVHLCSFASFCN